MLNVNKKRIVVTGADGLLGWHARAHLHAANCAARFRSLREPFDIIPLGKNSFNDDDELEAALTDADAVLHFAGVNRASDQEIEEGNPGIAKRLVSFCRKIGNTPHIVYANSTHAVTDTPYGRSKKNAGEILSGISNRYTQLVLPHIFGECARPYYNNVTATFIDQLRQGVEVTVNPEGSVDLLHAGKVAQLALEAVEASQFDTVKPKSTTMSVLELYQKLDGFHQQYEENIFPSLSTDFDVKLFNAYRAATYPDNWPRPLTLSSDDRGILFEAVKGGSGGQTFLSTTRPGITRGDHFHLHKVERFLVVKGEAIIRIRKVLTDTVWEYRVSGENPAPVDMPSLHTHSIENVGDAELITAFWTNEMFDPNNPDTYADKVVKQ